jgi:hypothetical protein
LHISLGYPLFFAVWGSKWTRKVTQRFSSGALRSAMRRRFARAARSCRADVSPLDGTVHARVGDHFEMLLLGNLRYFGFCDLSGGSADSFALAVGHEEIETVVMDCLRGAVKAP